MPPQRDDTRDRDLTRLVTALATEDTMTREELETVRIDPFQRIGAVDADLRDDIRDHAALGDADA
jgi:hypothetical protein